MGKDKKPPRTYTREDFLTDAKAEGERVEKLAEGVEAHEYAASFTGMCCGAMVMRDGGGDQCGLPYGHSLHVDLREDRVATTAETARRTLAERAVEPHEYQNPVHGQCGLCGHGANATVHLSSARRQAQGAPGPLAEIQEKTFEHTAEGAPGAFMEDVVRDIVAQLYREARTAGYTPVDATVTIEVTAAPERVGVASKPTRPRIKTTVRAWKAVAL